MGTRLIQATSGVLVAGITARYLGPDGLGLVRWVVSVTAIATFGANLGLHAWVTREVAKDPPLAGAVLPGAWTATALLSLLTGVGITAYAAVFDGRPEVVVAAAFSALGLWWQAATQMVTAVFHGLHRVRVEVKPTLWGRLVYVAAHATLLPFGAGLGALFAGRAVANLTTLWGLLAAYRREIGPIRLLGTVAEVRRVLAQGRAFGATVLFGAIYAQADVLMMAELRGERDVGIYAAAAQLVLQTTFFAHVVSRALFPRLVASASEPERLAEELSFEVRIHLFVSLGVGVVAAALAGPIVHVVFGPGFEAAVPCLQVLALGLPLKFVSNGLGMALTAIGRQGRRARVDGAAALFNLAINLAIIPVAGPFGASVTTLATDLLLVVLLWWVVRAVVPTFRPFGSAIRAALAFVAAFAAGQVVHLGDGWVQLVVGGALVSAVYVGAALGLRVLTVPELRRLLKA